MHNPIYNTLTATVMTLALSACGGGNDNSTPNQNNANNGAGETSMPAPNQTPINTNDNNTPSQLNGTWSSGCIVTIDLPLVAFAFEEKITFQDDLATQQVRFYIDNGCETADDDVSFVAEYSMIYGDIVDTDLGNATEADATLEAVSVNGQPAGEDELQDPALVQPEFGILLVSDSVLYRGDFSGSLNGTTAALRPNSLDQARPFYRQ